MNTFRTRSFDKFPGRAICRSFMRFLFQNNDNNKDQFISCNIIYYHMVVIIHDASVLYLYTYKYLLGSNVRLHCRSLSIGLFSHCESAPRHILSTFCKRALNHDDLTNMSGSNMNSVTASKAWQLVLLNMFLSIYMRILCNKHMHRIVISSRGAVWPLLI